jgi:hypothetical protein
MALPRSPSRTQKRAAWVAPLGAVAARGALTARLVEQMEDGRLEGIVLEDRTAPYRDGSRAGWAKVKDRPWYAREAWRFDRR